MRLADAMRAYTGRISRAITRDMEGCTFARGASLAPGRAFGEDEMHLEP